MRPDDGGSAFGGKATAWKVIGDDDKALELGQALAKEGGLKSLVISEEDSKRIEQLTLHLPSMSLRMWLVGQYIAGQIRVVEIDKDELDEYENKLADRAFRMADKIIVKMRKTEKGEN